MENVLKSISTIESEVLKEMESEGLFNEKIPNKFILKESNLLHKIFLRMISKLLFKLKIKITIYCDETELFNFEIPKN